MPPQFRTFGLPVQLDIWNSSSCHFYTTIRPLYFDFIDFPALLYDKIRDLSLGLCLQSVLTSMSDVSILLRIYVWRVWMKRLQYLGTAERQGRIAGTLVK
jgi:hypothetical protein